MGSSMQGIKHCRPCWGEEEGIRRNLLYLPMEFVCICVYLPIIVISGKLYENKEQPQDPKQKKNYLLSIMIYGTFWK